MKELERKKKVIVLTVIFAGYLLFNGILLAGHELWRDEANVWLLARDVSPIQLLKEIKYQGHPCLWYYLVMPFAKLGFPFMTISIISFIIMSVTAGIFVFKAPFHFVTKAICLFSPMFSYYYPVVARNYCLIALLLILLAFYYKVRNQKSMLYGLLLGLLVQADTIALATAGMISVMWLAESAYAGIKEKSRKPLLQAAKGLWIPLASFFLWIAEFYRVSESPEFEMHILSASEMLSEIRNFSYHILTRMTGQGSGFDFFLIVLFFAAGILLSLKLKNFWFMLITAGTFLFEAVFSVLVYQLHIWHYITVCFALIWFFWIGLEMGFEDREGEKKEEQNQEKETDGNKKKIWNKGVRISVKILAEGLLILLGITMFIRWNAPEENSSFSNALHGLYSDGVHAAEYITENLGTDELIVVTDVAEAATVQAYLGKDYTLYYAGNQKAETFANYNEDQKKTIAYEQLLTWVKNTFPEKEFFYLLWCPSNCIDSIADEEKEVWEICYQTKEETARGEHYTIYKIVIPDSDKK